MTRLGQMIRSRTRLGWSSCHLTRDGHWLCIASMLWYHVLTRPRGRGVAVAVLPRSRMGHSILRGGVTLTARVLGVPWLGLIGH